MHFKLNSQLGTQYNKEKVGYMLLLHVRQLMPLPFPVDTCVAPAKCRTVDKWINRFCVAPWSRALTIIPRSLSTPAAAATHSATFGTHWATASRRSYACSNVLSNAAAFLIRVLLSLWWSYAGQCSFPRCL